MNQNQASQLIRIACRALGKHSLAHAYGHCSIRLDDHHILVSPAKPPALAQPSDPCTVVPLEGAFPAGLLGEVRIHREIYKRRLDVNAIIRCQPPKTISLSAMGLTALPRHGFGTYFWPAPAFWPDPQLLRNDESAQELAVCLGDGRAIVMRGNGAVITGSSMEEALTMTWYLEDSARVELEYLASSGQRDKNVLSQDECRNRAVFSGQIVERMWAYLTAQDPEVGD